jgi:2-C-methyl-D-erythritol 2,4-cyclodiphosphate synthase
MSNPGSQSQAVKPGTMRIGHGYDLHRLEPGNGLMLAGVHVPAAVSPIAHSDGDVVLHAVADALLGAMGWGDIGQWFPNTDERWKNAESRVFVQQILDKLHAEGFSVGNLDVTILAERPKLAGFRAAMVKNLSDLLQAPANVKAGTNEGCDSIGNGSAIAAHAVVLVRKN